MPSLQIMPMSSGDQSQSPTGGLHIEPMNQPGTNPSGLVATGGMPGMVSKMTSGARTQVIPAGSAFTTPAGKIKSAPASSEVSTAQKELATINQMKPLFKSVGDDANTFLAPGAMFKVHGEQLLGWLNRNIPGNTHYSMDLEKYLNMSPENLSKYNSFQTNLRTLAHQYLTAHGWANVEPNATAALVAVSPSSGESSEGYVKRMSQLFNYLNQGIGNVNKQILKSGFSTEPAQTENNVPKPAASPANVPSAPSADTSVQLMVKGQPMTAVGTRVVNGQTQYRVNLPDHGWAWIQGS